MQLLIHEILYFFPAFLGPLIVLGVFHARAQGVFLPAYLIFLTLTLAWIVLQKLVVQIELRAGSSDNRNRARERGKEIIRLILSFALLLFVLGTLHYARQRFNETFFYLLLSYFAFSSLKLYFIRKRKTIPGLLFCILNFVALGVCSYFALLFVVDWQIVVFALACACMLTSLELVQEIWKAVPAGVNSELLARAYGVLVCFAPGLLAGLAAYDQLPKRFLATIIIIPLAAKNLSRVKLVGLGQEPELLVRREATGICALFFVTIVLLIIC